MARRRPPEEGLLARRRVRAGPDGEDSRREQREPAFGGRVDTAVDLRGVSALALGGRAQPDLGEARR